MAPSGRESGPNSYRSKNRVRECSGKDLAVKFRSSGVEEDQINEHINNEEVADVNKPLLPSPKTKNKSTVKRWVINNREWKKLKKRSKVPLKN